NYPNPFNPATTIEFALPQASEWRLTVYNILGQTVDRWSGEDEPGYYKVSWDAGKYASGVYFYRLTAGGYSATKKMILLK
ncbi:MAG: T9SS type A sorting domain-containing protein, partial [candidate division Zixibacteria bacterium]|nr:T9SS type A sorting domain-containing protein [candidate division Zixibacteria bacterium]